MSRRHAAEKREICQTQSLVIAFCQVHEQPDDRRQKIRAERIVYNAIDRVEDKIKRAL